MLKPNSWKSSKRFATRSCKLLSLYQVAFSGPLTPKMLKPSPTTELVQQFHRMQCSELRIFSCQIRRDGFCYQFSERQYIGNKVFEIRDRGNLRRLFAYLKMERLLKLKLKVFSVIFNMALPSTWIGAVKGLLHFLTSGRCSTESGRTDISQNYPAPFSGQIIRLILSILSDCSF